MGASVIERPRRGLPVLRGSLIVWLILSAVTALPARAADLMI